MEIWLAVHLNRPVKGQRLNNLAFFSVPRRFCNCYDFFLVFEILNFRQINSTDSVTRVKIFGDSDSIRVKLRKKVSRLESQSMTQNSSQSNFYKIFEPLMNKHSLFAHKEMSIYDSVMIKIGVNFLFSLSSRAMPFF